MIEITVPLAPITKKNHQEIMHSSIIVSHDGSRVLYDKDNPRTEVFIREMEGADGTP